VIEIGKCKKNSGEQFFVPHREKKIITSIVQHNPGPLSKESVSSVFNEIINSCRSLEKRLTVAYAGNQKSTTYYAAVKKFGKFTDYAVVNTISEVFSKIEKNGANYGVVPSIHTDKEIVTSVFDMFISSDLKIYSEICFSHEERFFIVGKTVADPSGQDKTSIIIAIKDKVGTLDDTLSILRKNKINLTMIESVPSVKTDEYMFYLDFTGHVTQKNVQKMLSDLNKKTVFLKVVGSYPIDN
jgi:prephenate dehydratase